jgi:calnexin
MKIVNFAFVGYGFSSFVEIFDESWNVRWSPSTATKKSEAADDTPEYLRYTGSWAAEKVSLLQEQDWALKLVDNAKHSAISAVFTPYDPKEGIVVQYEVNPVDGLECGGSYLKLFTENGQFDQAEMTDKTPYTIMFGPDVCGGNNKVHFIFRHMNPISKVWEEKHMKNNVASGLTAGVWTLYTLIVKPDQTFEILINNKSEAKGSLLEVFIFKYRTLLRVLTPRRKSPTKMILNLKM